ncbi:nucleoside-diphosphate kinase, partial [Psychrobacillus psychrotolerans]
LTVGKNIIHGSDAPESAEREIGLFFKQEELVSYKKDANNWIN